MDIVNASTLEEAVQNVDRTALAARREEAEAQRAEILKRFPMADWPELPLHRYALGTEESGDSFCWWMEFGAVGLGSIKGGSARKHLIFKQSGDQGWYYPERYSSVEEAWHNVRAGFAEAFQHAHDDQWNQIDSISALVGGRAIRTKALHVYFPDDVLPVYSYHHIIHFLKALGAYDQRFNDLEVVSLNRALLNVVRRVPFLAGWDLIEIMGLLYRWADPRTASRKSEDDKDLNLSVQPSSDSGREIIIDEELLARAVEATIRPVLIDDGGLEPDGAEGYQPHKIIPEARPLLSPESLSTHPQESVIGAIKSHFNLLSQYEFMNALAFLEDADPETIRQHTQELLYGESNLEQRIENFLEWGNPYKGQDGKERALNATIASYLLGISQPEKYAFCKPTIYSAASRALLGKVVSSNDPALRVAHCADFYRAVLRVFRDVHGLPFSDLMHVHIAFYVMQSDEIEYPSWTELTGRVQLGEEPPSTGVPFSVDDALADLFVDRQTFERWLNVIQTKKNVILQGPPGVGKTFVAKRLAYALMGERDDRRVEMVQFHQAYTYEDFIQGFRPSEDGNFRLKNGTFHHFCERAKSDPDRDYVFIIDEINRGNLSKILGELMMLIEADKRGPDWSMPLTYSQDSTARGDSPSKFFVPANVYLIGMMNTADRSLAMVDYALRRRFAFIALMPQFQSSRFSDFLSRAGVSASLIDRIVRRMTYLNNTISDDATNLGEGFCIGHSYFCPTDRQAVDSDWYDRVIDLEIAPLVREYWFDKPNKADELISALKTE